MQTPSFNQFILIISLIISLSACKNDNTDYSVDPKTYESQTDQLEKTEKKMPQKFLSVKNSDKKNILGQTVVRGRIFNTAKVATFKDVELKLQFFSKTGVLLEEDIETIYEKIAPGESRKFKSKYFSPKGSDSVSIIVQNATPVREN